MEWCPSSGGAAAPGGNEEKSRTSADRGQRRQANKQAGRGRCQPRGPEEWVGSLGLFLKQLQSRWEKPRVRGTSYFYGFAVSFEQPPNRVFLRDHVKDSSLHFVLFLRTVFCLKPIPP